MSEQTQLNELNQRVTRLESTVKYLINFIQRLESYENSINQIADAVNNIKSGLDMD